ncbi:lactose-binding lectin l-2-like [Ruditapes philippinarum]|uniref:lactose-binding lectin l-2-like n=1 Tax=Ruditapes philippinarum TaxID=129788 RepID=UPI00295B37FD|nr:lactose-binding lectin l-2-like [Ruditapes philippinarum]
MKKYCFNIGLLLFHGLVLPIDSRNIMFTKFTMHTDLEGFTCPAMNKDFEEEKLNVMQCLLVCADSSSCFGVFHDEADMHCVGCNDTFLTNSSAPSRDGMQYFKRQAYMLVTEEKSWPNARLHCQTLGGHLADITSEEEEIYIEDQILGSDYTSDTWIGASRKTLGGIYYWEDGTLLTDHYVKWGQDQPWDNRDEKCAALSWMREMTWTWHDYYCQYLFRSLCEFE